MRLFDKVVARYPDAISDLASCTVLAVDPIVEVASREWKSESPLCYDRFPFCKPPFESTFVEANVPMFDDHILCNLKQFATITQELSNEIRDPHREPGSAAASLDREHPDAQWYLTSFFTNLKEQITWLKPKFLWAIGSCHGLRFASIAAADRPANLDELSYKQGLLLVRSFFECTLLAFTFTNCSNVKLIDVTEDIQPEPKVRRRLKIPDIKRYTLSVQGHVARPNREYSEVSRDVMPFHLCRGHFATYTEERPLFGKYTGRFWIPPHTRGKKENGEIIKDYAIAADQPDHQETAHGERPPP